MTKRYYQEIPSKIFEEPESQITMSGEEPEFLEQKEEPAQISEPPLQTVSDPPLESVEVQSKTAAFNMFNNIFDPQTNKIFGLIALDDIILLVLIFLFLSDFLNDDILLLIFAAIFILGL